MGVSVASAVVPSKGMLLGRASVPGIAHPAVVTVRDGALLRHHLARGAHVARRLRAGGPRRTTSGMPRAPGSAASAMHSPTAGAARATTSACGLLSPIDLQAVKAAGVTFVVSLLERVIEEQARGDKAQGRGAARGNPVADRHRPHPSWCPVRSPRCKVKQTLIARGVWSQYLEVGIGPDAEIFTKGQPMASVGYGADVGHPADVGAGTIPSRRWRWWSTQHRQDRRRDAGQRRQPARRRGPLGAAAGQGQGQQRFGLAGAVHPPVRRTSSRSRPCSQADIALTVTGEDGFELEGKSSMSQISRIAGSAGRGHDRAAPPVSGRPGALPGHDVRAGAGSRRRRQGLHPQAGRRGLDLDALARHAQQHGCGLSTECPPWTYGTSHLLRDLARLGCCDWGLRNPAAGSIPPTQE